MNPVFVVFEAGAMETKAATRAAGPVFDIRFLRFDLCRD
jgi:hypothetical protein